MENRHSESKHAVLQSQINRRSLGPLDTCKSHPKVAFCMQKPQMRAGTQRD